ncbi:NADH-quinone oxidoreductase subunit B [Striga asiatica]|uniref:NADH-quinone oxidoreductase subunit B n=1 Tax=Striga asiatica TaxID=4170 RepID=A0A5A7R0Q2_STRAF|nr:NADH-quinone oxidoreductase subunit B [Striga asiatica]
MYLEVRIVSLFQEFNSPITNSPRNPSIEFHPATVCHSKTSDPNSCPAAEDTAKSHGKIRRFRLMQGLNPGVPIVEQVGCPARRQNNIKIIIRLENVTVGRGVILHAVQGQANQFLHHCHWIRVPQPPVHPLPDSTFLHGCSGSLHHRYPCITPTLLINFICQSLHS